MKLKALATLACIVALGTVATGSLAAPPGTTTGGNWADGALFTAVRSTTRSPQFVARDQYRHPRESLSFWGLRPGMTILEIWPSGGYWTEILAPYAKATNGRYIAAVSSTERPLNARFNNAAVYGTITTSVFNEKSGPLAAPGTVDFLLTARNIHDWPVTPGMTEKAFADFYAALKPGGILAVEDHRSDPRPMKKDASDGYISTAAVVTYAQDAGFKLEAQSEINANPKDTKDYPFGVWTLPPTRQSAAEGQPADPKFDHAKYDAIGESDRMTLRFRKPG
jgi:predicted methyltransferase